MKKLLLALAILLMPSVALAQKTKAALTTEVNANFASNSNISAATLRTTVLDIINSIFPTAPVGSGNLACFNGTTGLLQDCGSAPGSFVVLNGAGGTPSSIVLTNATGLPANALTGTISCAQEPALTGDVTSSAGSCATTLTNAPVIAKVLTGYTSGAGTLSAADSILSAIQKLNGNDALAVQNANLVYFYGTLTANQSVTSGTFAKANLTSSVDNKSYWSVANHNYVPLIAGTYSVCLTTSGAATFTTGLDVEGAVGKNGIVGGAGTTVILMFSGAITGVPTSFTASGCGFVAMNGSTDTLELDAAITGTSPNIYGATGASGAGATSLTIQRVGP